MALYLPKLDFFKYSSETMRNRVAECGPKRLALPAAEPPNTTTFFDPQNSVVVVNTHPNTVDISLQDFHSLVCCEKSIENTHILYTELYSKWTGRVTHQFVILELQLDNRPTVWVKLEQTLAYLRYAIAHFGVAPAYDKVR